MDEGEDSLPILACLDEIVTTLTDATPVVVKAPPGAGKTTGVPPALLRSKTLGDGKILLIQPRRLAARAAASRLAALQRCKLGTQVGYQIRFDHRATKQTQLIAMTTGMLLRRLQSDPLLEDVSCVILDEFHERSLEIDLALGMVHRIRSTFRPELRLVVMSATLDPQPIADFIGGRPIVSEGRAYPVTIHYTTSILREPMEKQIAEKLPQLLSETNGDVLVFLPGVGEIHRAQRELASRPWSKSLAIHPLYGDLTIQEQDEVLEPGAERKVILSTNVAETSVTIPGVTGVLDTGFVRMMNVDRRVGLPKLERQSISKASAEQRAGRAGRTQPGVCYRLWPEAIHRSRPEQDLPEISRGDLAAATLQLAAWGERDVEDFPWLTPPKDSAVHHAKNLLRQLSAIDEAGNITPTGHRMAALPIHPRMARFLLKSEELGIREAASLAVAVLTERDPTRGLLDTGSILHRCDVYAKVSQLRSALSDGKSHRNSNAIKNAKRIANQLERLLQQTASVESTAPDDEVDSGGTEEERMRRSLLSAFPDRLARRRQDDATKGVMVGGRGVRRSKRASVRESELFLCIDIDAGGSEATVHVASDIDEDWLAPERLRTETEYEFQPTSRAVIARRCTYFEDLLLHSTPVECKPHAQTTALLAQHARLDLAACFPKNHATEEFLQRVRFLNTAMPNEGLPALDEQAVDEVLLDLCQRCTSISELSQSPWLDHLRGRYSYEQIQKIDRYAPAKMTVPSGNTIAIRYQEGKRPRMEVRIQEIFGWNASPRLAQTVPLQLHLLGPNYRPQQITDDLENFWAETYTHIRKELRRRYPKHHWPENPLTAVATRNGLKPK
jgi:ATP-dependent helicase HrpB